MAVNWNEYELVLEAESSKECEVTGRDMGGTETFTCPVSDLIENKSPKWTPEGNLDKTSRSSLANSGRVAGAALAHGIIVRP